MKSIDDHIKKDMKALDKAEKKGDKAAVRHLIEEIDDLQEYKSHNPGDDHDPTPLEIMCDKNPSAPECLLYDD